MATKEESLRPHALQKLQLELFEQFERWGNTSVSNPILQDAFTFFLKPFGVDCRALCFNFLAAAIEHQTPYLEAPVIRLTDLSPADAPQFEAILKDFAATAAYFDVSINARGRVTAVKLSDDFSDMETEASQIVNILSRENSHAYVYARAFDALHAFLQSVPSVVFRQPMISAVQTLHQAFLGQSDAETTSMLLEKFYATCLRTSDPAQVPSEGTASDGLRAAQTELAL